MISKEEFEDILIELNELIRNELDGAIPEVSHYDADKDGTYGRGCICSLSSRRKMIIINYDVLVNMYPYMDRDSVKKMLASMIRHIEKNILP